MLTRNLLLGIMDVRLVAGLRWVQLRKEVSYTFSTVGTSLVGMLATKCRRTSCKAITYIVFRLMYRAVEQAPQDHPSCLQDTSRLSTSAQYCIDFVVHFLHRIGTEYFILILILMT